MIYILSLGLVFKDIKKNKFFILIFYLQLAISSFFILISISQFTNDFNLYNYLNNIKDKEVVTFKSYYKESDVFEGLDMNSQKLLNNIYNEQKCAYSYLLSNQIEKYPDKNVYVVVGEFNDIFDIGISDTDNNIAAYLGYNVLDIDISEEFSFGYEKEENVKFCGVLNKNSYFYHRNFKIDDLDDSILISIPYKKLNYLYGGRANEELIQNTNFVKHDTKTIESFITTINKSKIINVVPYNSYDLYIQNYHFSFYNSLLFFLFFIIFLGFTICGIIINIINNINKNLREYAIHITYGATKFKIFMRIILYLTCIILPVVLISSFFIYVSDMFGNINYLQLILLTITLLLSLLFIILLYPISKFWNKNFSIYYRRDV